MPDKDLVVLGKIVSVHGIRGAIKVYSFTNPIDKILDYKKWILCNGVGTEQKEVKLLAGHLQGKLLVVQLDSLTDREEARKLAEFEICVKKDDLPILANNEYYWYQLQGLKVINQKYQLLGIVDYLLETGANDVLVVKPCIDSVDDRERLLPYIASCVLSVDLVTKELIVNWNAEF